MKPMLILAVVLAAVAGRAGDDAPKKRVIRVLCYNIHHAEGTDGKVDLPRIADVITAAKPDLVALQEVDNKTRRTGGIDQAAELARLTGLHGKFGKAIDHDGGEYGQAILSRHPIGELIVHRLPNEAGREQRVAVAATVRTPDGRELVFVSTHLDHQRDDLRQKQAAELNELFGGSEGPVVLAGDLNATPDSKPLAILGKNWTKAEAGKPLPTIPVEKPTRQIDFVLYRPAGVLRVVEAKVIDEPVASDHRPVLAVLELTE